MEVPAAMSAVTPFLIGDGLELLEGHALLLHEDPPELGRRDGRQR